MDLKIIGWTDFDCEFPTRKVSGEDLSNLVLLIQQEIYDKGYIFGGEDHQLEATGVPVFNDGTCFRASMRCWGLIMSQIYQGPNGEEYSYMDFYMFMDEESILPEYKELDVLPNPEGDDFSGIVVPTDQEIVYQSLSAGMPFITTDKALQVLYEYYKERLEEELEKE